MPTMCKFHTHVNCISEVRQSLQQIQLCINNIAGGAVAGMTDYLSLSDVMPFDTTYVGKAHHFPKVVGAETGIQLFDLFGSNNHFTGFNTFDTGIDITDLNTGIDRLTSGVLGLRGNTSINIFSGGTSVASFKPGSPNGGYIDFLTSGGDPRIDWQVADTLKFMDGSGVVQLMTNTSGVTVGTLTGFIKGTTGLLSAVSAITLTTDVTGTLPIGNGGTGQTSQTAAFDALSPLTTLGDTLYHDGSDNVRLAGNTTTARTFLTQTGNGTVSAAPSWFDLFNTANTWTGVQTFTDEILINNSGTAIQRNGSGVLLLVGLNRLQIEGFGAPYVEFYPGGLGGGYMSLGNSAGSSARIDWQTSGNIKFQDGTGSHVTQMTVNSSGVTVGSLDNFVVATAGLLSEYDLFGSDNHFTGLNTFDNEIDISDGNTFVWRPASGRLGLTGTTSVEIYHGATVAATFTGLALSLNELYIDEEAIGDPGNPATNNFRIFTRLNGSTIELVSRAPLGGECVLCSHPNVTVNAELQLNWVE